MRQRKNPIPKNWRTSSDKIRYAYIDKLYEQLQWGGAYTLVHITDEFMGALEKNAMSIHAFKNKKEIQI